jgi:hypothetical protein
MGGSVEKYPDEDGCGASQRRLLSGNHTTASLLYTPKGKFHKLAKTSRRVARDRQKRSVENMSYAGKVRDKALSSPGRDLKLKALKIFR